MCEKLKKLRQNNNVPTKKLLNALGLKSFSAYYKKESGRLRFSLMEAKIISDFFKMPIEEIFF